MAVDIIEPGFSVGAVQGQDLQGRREAFDFPTPIHHYAGRCHHQAWSVHSPRFFFNEDLLETGRKLRAFDGIEDIAVPASFKGTLRPYQKLGLNWLQFQREYNFGGILADDMGLGKTVQVIALLLLEKARGNMTDPTMVVVPTSLIFNWAHELKRLAPDLTFSVWHGPDRHNHPERLI